MTDFPSYPGGPGPEPYPGSVQQPYVGAIPRSVQNAVKLMYVGAGLEVLGLIIGLTTTSSIRSAYKSSLPDASTSTINTDVHAVVAAAVVGSVIGIALWLWMAQKNKAGRNWARITGTVFFGISTLSLIANLAEHISVLGKLLSLVVWVLGLAIVVLLWRRESSAYFKPQPQSNW